MNPLRFEVACLARARGSWIALVLACAPAIAVPPAMLLMRHWGASHQGLARVWWPTAFYLALTAQAAMLPLLQMYLLGDSLAGQASDNRLRTLLLCPVSRLGLYLGKLGAASIFSAVSVALSILFILAGGICATAGTEGWDFVLSRGYERAIPLGIAIYLAAQLALTAYEALVFSLAGSLKTGLLGVAALTGAMLAVQLGAYQSENFKWAGHLTFTYHYVHGLGFEILAGATTGRLEAGELYGKALAAFLADAALFAGLGYWAFRRREV
ncbi:MAG: ABC transporter permease [Candidatus Wallbacteria bacterium]|nr:ABC transporter permease [Candidatus Wallbacteria bacterium]